MSGDTASAQPADKADTIATRETAPPPSASPGWQSYTGPDGILSLDHPDQWAPGKDFAGRALMNGGWRSNFGGSPDAPGRGLVSFTQTVQPSDGPGQAVEMLRIGASADPAAVADCATAGLDPAFGPRLPDRTIDGVVWQAMRQSDAGMSQQVDVRALRTVHRGTCYAVDRVTYAIKASDPDTTLPAQAAVTKKMDKIVETIRLAR